MYAATTCEGASTMCDETKAMFANVATNMRQRNERVSERS